MHCIRTQVLPQPYKAAQLQQAIFKPIITDNNIKQTHSRKFNFSTSTLYQSTKRLLQALSIVALILPTKSLTNTTELGAFNKVLSSKTFDVATIASDSTLFQYGEHQHGFGYDVARTYAEHLDAELNLHHFNSNEEAILALNTGKVDAILTDNAINDNISNDTLEYADVSCGLPLTNQGLSNDTRLTFKSGDKFATHATDYLCNVDTMSNTWHLAKFYNQNTLDDYSQWYFDKVMTERLPSLKNTFVAQANKHNHDWALLAAISYQESQLNPDAVSPTGVRGIMMLTNDTAEAMGISDRTNPIQSIQGGAKYLEILNKEFAHIAEEDRLWFVLASYNMGPNAVKRIQTELGQSGKNPHSWGEFYRYLHANESKNSRYTQCIHYVTNIRTYLESIQSFSVA